jgi:hypothetical protein
MVQEVGLARGLGHDGQSPRTQDGGGDGERQAAPYSRRRATHLTYEGHPSL